MISIRIDGINSRRKEMFQADEADQEEFLGKIHCTSLEAIWKSKMNIIQIFMNIIWLKTFGSSYLWMETYLLLELITQLIFTKKSSTFSEDLMETFDMLIFISMIWRNILGQKFAGKESYPLIDLVIHQ